MNTKETIRRDIEKIADFQMRQSTPMRFLEICIYENVLPTGLMLKLQVQVGKDNNDLPTAVNRVLETTSLEITRLIAEDHYRQLKKSKSKMAELEKSLSTIVKGEDEINIISHKILSNTENKKNLIFERQNKKLKRLVEVRDGHSLKDDVVVVAVENKATENKYVCRKQKQEGPKGHRSLTGGKGQRSQWSNLQSTTNDAIYQIRKLFSFRQ